MTTKISVNFFGFEKCDFILPRKLLILLYSYSPTSQWLTVIVCTLPVNRARVYNYFTKSIQIDQYKSNAFCSLRDRSVNTSIWNQSHIHQCGTYQLFSLLSTLSCLTKLDATSSQSCFAFFTPYSSPRQCLAVPVALIVVTRRSCLNS